MSLPSRPECVQKIKQARADIGDGNGKTYASIDDFTMVNSGS